MGFLKILIFCIIKKKYMFGIYVGKGDGKEEIMWVGRLCHNINRNETFEYQNRSQVIYIYTFNME